MMGKRNSLSRSKHRHCGDSTSSSEEAATQKPMMNRQLDHDDFDAVNLKKPKREAFPIDDHEVDAKDEDSESKYEIHKQVKQQNKDELRSSRRPQVESLPEVDDGKRPITYEMEKNRGLTRRRKKLSMNPRKKYKVYHIYKMDRREGRVQKVKKPMGSYGGEATGINP
ncbi:hypothetical protein TIFTF001_025628 [Ficus carica]|uniref:Sas10 C-terminal domain-containing protein n=1 Tax=Ficus carica TaxID=3494 RepID=A0AA88AQ67_FICCA|nr:hypothetical protein TIFTF001_025628 [Ficus carica]